MSSSSTSSKATGKKKDIEKGTEEEQEADRLDTIQLYKHTDLLRFEDRRTVLAAQDGSTEINFLDIWGNRHTYRIEFSKGQALVPVFEDRTAVIAAAKKQRETGVHDPLTIPLKYSYRPYEIYNYGLGPESIKTIILSLVVPEENRVNIITELYPELVNVVSMFKHICAQQAGTRTITGIRKLVCIGMGNIHCSDIPNEAFDMLTIDRYIVAKEFAAAIQTALKEEEKDRKLDVIVDKAYHIVSDSELYLHQAIFHSQGDLDISTGDFSQVEQLAIFNELDKHSVLVMIDPAKVKPNAPKFPVIQILAEVLPLRGQYVLPFMILSNPWPTFGEQGYTDRIPVLETRYSRVDLTWNDLDLTVQKPLVLYVLKPIP